jgi:ATP-binding cassette, subfamily C, bacteriocin exporter
MKKSARIKQRDMSDCGAACLASLAAYFGLYIPVSRIRQYAGTNRKGSTLLGLCDAAERLHFNAKAARADRNYFSDIPVPSIFHLSLENGLQHFVVVYKIRKSNVWYMDPMVGRLVRRSVSDFNRIWTGVVLLVIPSGSFARGNEKKSVYTRFWELVKPHKTMLIQALAGAIVYTILGLSTSVYVQKIIDFVLPDENQQLLNILSLFMILLLCFRVIIGYFKSMIALRTGQQIDCRLILGYFKHLMHLPQQFFDCMRVGEIISRINDAMRIRIFINDIALNVLVQLFTIILGVTAMFLYYWKLALIILMTLPLYLLIYFISNRLNSKWQRKTMEAGSEMESHLVETIQGISTIKRYGTEHYFNLKTENKLFQLMNAVFQGSRREILLSNASEWTTGLLVIIILWAGSHLVLVRVLSPGELLSFYTLVAFFTVPVQTLVSANKPMQDALVAADRLFEIIDLETETGEEEQICIENLPAGDLVFEDVQFSYGPGIPVFNGLKLRIRQNQITAITGESGCGKSTLHALLQKLYPLKAGSIRIGEMNIKDISTDVLRNRIGAVPQQTNLFSGDIISNISLGGKKPDMERLFEICRRLGIDEFVDRLPGRYQTVIREHGLNLSGGQRQRLGIARALYHDPDILILDEATSALDPESERKVLETLLWFYNGNKTIVVIAHRLSTVLQCSSVIFLNAGGRVISGTHEKLLLDCADYRRLWASNIHF